MKRNRLDRGERGEKAWEEFRTDYAAALLLALLLDDLEEIAPDYASTLRSRLNEGISAGEGHLEEDPSSDGPAEIRGPLGGKPIMMDLSSARLLEDQLFPDRERHDPGAFQQATRGMVVVALHSVLESFASALSAAKLHGPLPNAIAKFLSAKGAEHQLSSPLADGLTEFHETRRLIVHNRGVVDDTYMENVKHNKMREGERRPLTASAVQRYAKITWEVARKLRSATPPAS